MEGGRQPVKLNQETVFHITEKGVLHTSANSISCEGQEMKIDGEIVENMLRFAQYRVILQEETYILKDNHMEALNDHVILPIECTSSLGGCQVHDKTYVWKTIGHRCLLDQTK